MSVTAARGEAPETTDPGASEPVAAEPTGSPRAVAPRRSPGAARMRARASLSTELHRDPRGRCRSRLSGLRSEAPLVLRPTIAQRCEPWTRGIRTTAWVSLAAGAAGPVGGDELELTVRVGAGSALVLTEVSHTLLLPGRDGARSRIGVHVQVEDGGTLVWLPEPVIAARGCDHVNDVDVVLGHGSRLLLREEALLGRHGEGPGRLRQRIRVTREGVPIYQQDLQLGTATSRAPSVAGSRRAVGSLLLVDPGAAPAGAAGAAGSALSDADPAALVGPEAAVLPLAAGGVVVTALADDNVGLRTALEAGLEAVGWPDSAWGDGELGAGGALT